MESKVLKDLRYVETTSLKAGTVNVSSVGEVTGVTLFQCTGRTTTKDAVVSQTIGVGTSLTDKALCVNGDIQVSGGYYVGTTNLLDIVQANLPSLFSGELSTLTVEGDTSLGGVVTVSRSTNCVGINTSTPQYPLDVYGGINISSGSGYSINGKRVLSSTVLGSSVVVSNLASVGTLSRLNVTGSVNVDTYTLHVDSVNHKVGLGTSAPVEKLDVVGNVYIPDGSAYMVGSNSVLTATELGPSVLKSSLTSVGVLEGLTVSGDIHASGGFYVGSTNVIDLLVTSSSIPDKNVDSLFVTGNITVGTNTMFVDKTTKFVGIGTTVPICALDVRGGVGIPTGSAYTCGGTDILTETSLGTSVTSSSLTSVGTLSELNVSGGVSLGSGTLTVDNTKKLVGINSQSPCCELDVTGSINVSGDYKIGGTTVLSSSTLGSSITSSSLTSLGTLSHLDVSGNTRIGISSTLVVDVSTNRVGVCTSNLTHSLCVNGDVNLSLGSCVRINDVAVLGSDFVGTGITKIYGTLWGLNLQPNYTYKIGGVDVLSPTSLGSTVVNSSLTTVGVLDNLVVSNPNTANGTFVDAITATCPSSVLGNTVTVTFGVDGTPLNAAQLRFKYVTSSSTVGSSPNTLGLSFTGVDQNAMTITGYGTVGIGTSVLTPRYTLDVGGTCNTTSSYYVNGTEVLTTTTLGTTVKNSSLTSLGTLSTLTVNGPITLATTGFTTPVYPALGAVYESYTSTPTSCTSGTLLSIKTLGISSGVWRVRASICFGSTAGTTYVTSLQFGIQSSSTTLVTSGTNVRKCISHSTPVVYGDSSTYISDEVSTYITVSAYTYFYLNAIATYTGTGTPKFMANETGIVAVRVA